MDNNMLANFGGIRVFSSDFCTKKVYNFPPSNNRSARLHKKLIKRHGVQSYEVPTAYMVNGSLSAHPAIIKQMFETGKIVRINGQ